MTSRCLPSIAEKFSTVGRYRLGSTRISRTTSRSDFNSIVVGLSLWYGVILDYNDEFCNADEARTNQGRIFKHAIAGWSHSEGLLDEFLGFLDQVGELLLNSISNPAGFKGQLLLTEMVALSVAPWLASLRGALTVVFRAALQRGEQDEAQAIRACRQMTCFLKKLDVCRPDLEAEMIAEFVSFETELSTESVRRTQSIEYLSVVASMKQILDSHMQEFKLAPLVPGHGPGATADPLVRCWYDKHTHARQDRRIGYLLDHAGLGTLTDYLPLAGSDQSKRTSRYICVPKTWKKLRGISAEPVELQYFQQALLHAIDRMFRHDKWWAARIDLHDQQKSRDLALEGSITGDYATVDLSAASDSVTLQLVRDLFGNSLLGRWLVGTRSTHTWCGEQILKIAKFAPMGSACCFPVECIVFCLAAEVAVSRSHTSSDYVRQVRVFGDDIIVPSYAVHELFAILKTLGFSVNTEKSFWSGQFREACGVEAWAGHDIAPCRFRRLHSGISGRYTDYDELASTVAFANELFVRGLSRTREYLLTLLFRKQVRLGDKISVSAQQTILVTFSGECQTLISPCPTNFNVKKKFSRTLQTPVYKRVVWRERPLSHNIPAEISAGYDVCEYVTWLIRHQADDQDWDKRWSLGWLDTTASQPWSRLPIGVSMVPTVKWVVPASSDFLS